MDYQRRLDISSLKQSENPIILELKVRFCHVFLVPCCPIINNNQCLIIVILYFGYFSAESGPDQKNYGA